MTALAKASLSVAASFLLALGITMPLLTFEKLYFFEESPSLIEIVAKLFANGDFALGLVVVLFSVLFPFAKLVAVNFEAFAGENNRSRFAKLVPLLSKWSMMDVMLVALVIAAAKTSGLARAFTEPGLWFYAGSALCASLLQWIHARNRKLPRSQEQIE